MSLVLLRERYVDRVFFSVYSCDCAQPDQCPDPTSRQAWTKRAVRTAISQQDHATSCHQRQQCPQLLDADLNGGLSGANAPLLQDTHTTTGLFGQEHHRRKLVADTHGFGGMRHIRHVDHATITAAVRFRRCMLLLSMPNQIGSSLGLSESKACTKTSRKRSVLMRPSCNAS